MERKDFGVIREVARKTIKEQVANNGDALPWKNKERYAQLMLDAEVKSYKRISERQSSGIIFFDRGLLDTICYMRMENIPLSKNNRETYYFASLCSKGFHYSAMERIFQTDNERKQSWEEAVYTFDKMKQTYLEYGYDVIEVPKKSIGHSCDSISSSLFLICVVCEHPIYFTIIVKKHHFNCLFIHYRFIK